MMSDDEAQLRRHGPSAFDGDAHRAQLLREFLALHSSGEAQPEMMSAAEAGADGDTMLLRQWISLNTTVNTFSFASPYLRNMSNVMQAGLLSYLWCHTFDVPIT